MGIRYGVLKKQRTEPVHKNRGLRECFLSMILHSMKELATWLRRCEGMLGNILWRRVARASGRSANVNMIFLPTQLRWLT